MRQVNGAPIKVLRDSNLGHLNREEMTHTVVAAFWAAWTLYLLAQAYHRRNVNQRVGYLLSAILSATTSYLLVNP